MARGPALLRSSKSEQARPRLHKRARNIPSNLGFEHTVLSSPYSRRMSRHTPGVDEQSQQSFRSGSPSRASLSSAPDGIRDSIQAGDSMNIDAVHAADDASPEVILAIDLRNDGLLGSAVFSTLDGSLSLLNQIPMADINLCESLLAHVQPTTVLASARAPEHFLNFLERKTRWEHPSVDNSESSNMVLRALPSAEFSYEAAYRRVTDLHFENSNEIQAIISDDHNASLHTGLDVIPQDELTSESHGMKLMRCGSLIDLDDRVSVACAGAVLSDLHRRRSTGSLGGSSFERSFHVERIDTFSLSDYMLVNTDTLLSLQIMQSELHPNSQTWGLGAGELGRKESLSVYGLFHSLACTPQGRTRLRQIFHQPTLNLDTIVQRHRIISLLIRPENEEILRQSTSILRRISNIRTQVAQLRRGVDTPSSNQSFDNGVWATLRKFAAQILKLKECVTALYTPEIEIIRKLVDEVQLESLVNVGAMINKTIDFEQSKARQRPSVRAGIDPALDELKRRYDGMGSFLTAVVNRVNQELPEWACQYVRSCIFLPQLGFLMVVELDPETDNGHYEGPVDEQWEKLFKADGAVCYKNSYMKELDEQYGDMYCEIGDREVEVIHRLATAVIVHEEALVAASDICGEFDALLSLATGAKKFQWVEPQMTSDNVLCVEGGRHPLQELVVPVFVPNDCELSGSPATTGDDTAGRSKRAMVITGPNHSGKSVYLKQTALIVYLAHIGSYVPATRATIGLTDKILTRISTRESVARTESAFSIDLTQVSRIISCSTSKSLVIVDEFGKGTNTDDGAGLLAALAHHFFSMEQNMPRILIATHFHEALDDEFINLHSGLGLFQMSICAESEADEIEDQITYLFKVVPGICTTSFGGRCAALNGVPCSVVRRAEVMASLLHRHEDVVSACAHVGTDEQEQLAMAEVIARQFVQVDMTSSGRIARNQGEDVEEMLHRLLSLEVGDLILES